MRGRKRKNPLPVDESRPINLPPGQLLNSGDSQDFAPVNTYAVEGGQMIIDFDFYSERLTGQTQIKSQKGLPSGQQIQDSLSQSIVREPMRLLTLMPSLSVLERRIYWLVLAQIRSHQYRTDSGNDSMKRYTFHFHVSEILSNEDSRHTVWYIKEVVKQLGDRKILWEDHGNRYTQIPIFTLTDYEVGQARLTVQVHHALLPGFLMLGNNFAQYEIRMAMRLTSEYAQVLYTWLSKNLFRKTWEIELVEFKRIMNVQGKAYNEFSNLRQRVLDLAINQINTLTNLTVSYKTLLVGRKVNSLVFTMILNEEKQARKNDKKQEKTSLTSQIKGNLPDESMEEAYAENSREELNAALDEIINMPGKEKKDYAEKVLTLHYSWLDPAIKQQILDNVLFIDRFCVVDIYIAKAKVRPDKIPAYMMKSVFNPKTKKNGK